MVDWKRVEWTNAQLVVLRSKYEDAVSRVVRSRNDDAHHVLQILATEVERWNIELLSALRLCSRAANDSRLTPLA